MPRRVKEKDIIAGIQIAKAPKNPHDGVPMLARGKPHVLHSVGPMNPMGARTAMCKLSGSFFEPPEGLKIPRCEACYGPGKEA